MDELASLVTFCIVENVSEDTSLLAVRSLSVQRPKECCVLPHGLYACLGCLLCHW